MERRNFIKNLAALAVVSQIDITKADETQTDKLVEINPTENGLLDYRKLTLQSTDWKIELNCSDLTLEMNPIDSWQKISDVVEIPFNLEIKPLKYNQDLTFTAKLTEKQLTLINSTLWNRDKTEFMFEVDNMIYEGEGQLFENEFHKETLESNVLLRINSSNVIYNEI